MNERVFESKRTTWFTYSNVQYEMFSDNAITGFWKRNKWLLKTQEIVSENAINCFSIQNQETL